MAFFETPLTRTSKALSPWLTAEPEAEGDPLPGASAEPEDDGVALKCPR